MKIDQKPYSVCFMGASLDTGNMGVSALAASFVKIIRDTRPDSEVAFFIGNRSAEPQDLQVSGRRTRVNVVNYRLSPKASIHEHLLWIFLMACLQKLMPWKLMRNAIIKSNPWLKAMDQVDFVGEITGGDSFSDIYGLRRFIISLMPAIIALLLRKELLLLPQTYGPYASSIAKCMARFIVNRSSHILSRDKEGLDVIRELIGTTNGGKGARFCPDVAFMLDSIKPDKPDIQPPIDRNLHVPLIGLNVNGLMYNGGYTRDNMFRLNFDYRLFVRNLVTKILEDTKANLLLVPHTFGPPGNVNSDPDASRDVLQSVLEPDRDRVHMVMRQYNQSEIKGIIDLCDFFVGSRMHACIAALSQGIPTVGVAYSRKFRGVFDSIGVGDMVVDARSIDVESGIRTVLALFENRNRLVANLQEKVKVAQSTIRTTFEELLGH